jgi:hypothetical protein
VPVTFLAALASGRLPSLPLSIIARTTPSFMRLGPLPSQSCRDVSLRQRLRSPLRNTFVSPFELLREFDDAMAATHSTETYVYTDVFMPEKRAVGALWRSLYVRCGVEAPEAGLIDPSVLGALLKKPYGG